MIKTTVCSALSVALEKLKQIVSANEERHVPTVIFCEDRLSLAAERTVCTAVGGTFLTSVYTFSRFLAAECGKLGGVLSARGSAMAVRRIIEEHKSELALFGKLSAPDAAQTVYDTIALLYSSRVSPEDAAAASERGGLLGGKLKDISLIYSLYMQYLSDNGLEDRNVYLKRLGPVVEKSPRIKGAEVVFLGFQAFTRATTECASAAFAVAKDVTGLFIGGPEDIYVNEAAAAFGGAALAYGGAKTEYCAGDLLPEADVLRKGLFDPESLSRPPMPTGKVFVFEARDEEEELEFIAASIKRHVHAGERYAKISVMLPELSSCEGALRRVFSKYRIPYYADMRIRLSAHPLCAFALGWLSCAISGCRPQDVDGVVASPYFPASREDKNIFRNYCLRFAQYRGGVRRPIKPEAENFGYSAEACERVRNIFLSGLEKLTRSGIFGGLKQIFEDFGVGEKLEELSNKYASEYPTEAAFGARALEQVTAVLDEAEPLCAGLKPKDIVKVLKSGFTAAEISLIPPKADAVFVGDAASTANTGSNVVFAARLTGDVPPISPDISLLTDRELAALEEINLDISPKIRQVNMRKRETFALNACAFRQRLYLTYPVRLGGEENGPSEIVRYALRLFATRSGAPLRALTYRELEKTLRAVPYYAGEKLPAIKQMIRFKTRPAVASAIYGALSSHGYRAEADAALKTPSAPKISRGKELFLNYGSITPTALETYFSCPYLAFMRQGLRVNEREEGAARPVDTGNFIHSVLEDLAKEGDFSRSDASVVAKRAAELAEEKLSKPPYSSISDLKSGKYTASELKNEAVKLALGAFEQLSNSAFKISAAECKCEISLTPEVRLFGKIDRVDEAEGLVRVIDYKTGSVECSAPKYYTGLKLQLPLYLSAVSVGKRAAGAYYFPASLEYREKPDGVFRLQGYMDGSDEVVSASDVTLERGHKSAYFDAYLGGRRLEAAMEPEKFEYFIKYATEVSAGGANEMLSGNVAPSPAEGVCRFCKMGGSCNFAVGRDGGERSAPSVKCSEIAEIAAGRTPVHESGESETDGGQNTDDSVKNLNNSENNAESEIGGEKDKRAVKSGKTQGGGEVKNG